MAKKFKNSFGIEAGETQRKAFKEWAVNVGWTEHEDTGGSCLFFMGNDCEETRLKRSQFWDCGSFDDEHPVFKLPAQWAEAIAYASEEVEESKPTFIRGEKLVSDDLVVLCNGIKSETAFNATVIKGNDYYSFGEYVDGFSKKHFALHAESVTI